MERVPPVDEMPVPRPLMLPEEKLGKAMLVTPKDAKDPDPLPPMLPPKPPPPVPPPPPPYPPCPEAMDARATTRPPVRTNCRANCQSCDMETILLFLSIIL